jgi:guanylate kinase
MRKGESYSSPYYFVDIDTFYATEMVEYTEYNGFLYGTSKDEVDRVLGGSNSRAFVIVDRVGVEAFKALYPDMAKVIYIYASGKDLIERMTARGDDSDIVAERIAHAYTTGEFNNIDVADYCIVNKEFDKAIAQLRMIVE